MTVLVQSEVSDTSPSFFSSAYVAYSLLTQKPFAFFLFIVSIFSVFSLYNGQDSPYKILLDFLELFIKDNSHPAFVLTFAKTLISVLVFLLKYAYYFYCLSLVFVIYLVYIDRDITFTLLLLVAYIIVASPTQVINTAIIIQLVFLYLSMESLFERIILFSIAVFLLFGSDHLRNFFTQKKSS